MSPPDFGARQGTLDLAPRCPDCGRPWISDSDLLDLAIRAIVAHDRMRLALPSAIGEALKATAQGMRCRLGTCRGDVT